MTRQTARISVVLPLIAAGAALAGCGKPLPGPVPDAAPVPVRVWTVESKSRVATEDVVGTVYAKLRAVIESRVSARIERVQVSPGQGVKSNDVLVELDAVEIAARVEQAAAVRDQADKDLKRFTALAREQTITQAELEGVQSRDRVARAALAQAESMLGYTRIVAPFDGVITRKHVDVGDVAAPGKALLEMEDPGVLRIEANVPEALAGGLSLGEKVRARVGSVPGEFEVAVSEIWPAGDPVSRTFVVKFDCPAMAGLRAGQFGRVSIPVGESAALRVPASAVVRRGQMEMVFVVADNRAQLRLVKTGRRVGDELELVSGLDAGERVVMDGVATLVDGQPLRVQ